jgi:ABC-type multidrug transport system fused ATPase/permease subunit
VKTVRRVGGLLAPYWGRVVLAFVLTCLACLLNLPVPVLVQALVDQVVAGGRFDVLPWYAAGLLAVILGQAVLGLTHTLVVGTVGLAVLRDLRHRLYARLQCLSLSWYDRTPAGSILSRLMDDVAAVQGLITGQTFTILTDLGTALAVSALLLWRSPRLFLVAVAFVPAYALTFRWFGGRIRAGSTAVRNRLDGVFGHLKTKIDGILVVLAHGREPAEVESFARQIQEAHGPRVRLGRMGAAFSNLSLATSGIGASAVFAAGAFEVLHGRMTPGEAVAAAALAGLLFGPIARLADLAALLQQAAASFDRIGEILDQQPEVADPVKPVPLGRARARVEFDRVGFAYRPGQRVLHDVCLHVEPGMKVALVGPTGCGKTTLLNLLMRFYDPLGGEVRLDGIPLYQLALADLRRQIGIVLQEPVLFRGSLADNIRYGSPDADLAHVEAAARAALVHGFATRLPQGYDTLVGEGGHKLSQGERQRVAIARAFCKDPALIVLDEATSSLDTAGETLIQKALGNLLRGRTAFIVAHRLSTVLGADWIVVLDAGRIVQEGTHQELMADADGLYRRLCDRQFGAAPTAALAPRCNAPLLEPSNPHGCRPVMGQEGLDSWTPPSTPATRPDQACAAWPRSSSRRTAAPSWWRS